MLSTMLHVHQFSAQIQYLPLLIIHFIHSPGYYMFLPHFSDNTFWNAGNRFTGTNKFSTHLIGVNLTQYTSPLPPSYSWRLHEVTICNAKRLIFFMSLCFVNSCVTGCVTVCAVTKQGRSASHKMIKVFSVVMENCSTISSTPHIFNNIKLDAHVQQLYCLLSA